MTASLSHALAADPSALVDEEAAKTEVRFVHEVYEAIAPHFSETRFKVEQYLVSLERHSLVADIGCGNGKYLPVASQCWCIGFDRSPSLVRIAASRGFDCGVADNLLLPIRSHVFDHVVSIAVLHHLSTPARRLTALAELLRVVRTDGTVMVCVWASEQPRADTGPDVLVPWQRAARHGGSATFQRYYHLFAQGELEALGRQAGACVLRSGYDHGNWWAVLQPGGGVVAAEAAAAAAAVSSPAAAPGGATPTPP